MIAQALQDEIHRYAQRMPVENPLYWKAEKGLLVPGDIARYLASIHPVIEQTSPLLRRARDGARARGNEPLATYFEGKHAEEEGHHEWAENDIRAIAKMKGGSEARMTPAAKGILGFVTRIIDEDPSLYLAYILFAEHLVALLGPEWVALLEQRCGIPASSITVVAKHAELDAGHTDEHMIAIDALVTDPNKLDRLLDVLREAIAWFDALCAEVTGEPRKYDERLAVPAA